MADGAATGGEGTGAAPSGGEAQVESTQSNQAAATEAAVENTTEEANEAPEVTETEETEEDSKEKAKEKAPKETKESKEAKEEKPARKGSKDWAKENLEQDFDDDEGADDFVREFASKSQTLNKQLLGIFEENPEVGIMLSKMTKDGTPFLEALAEFITPEELSEILESSEKSKETLAERRAKLAGDKKMAEAIEANKAKSETALVDFMKENSMDEKATGKFFDETVLPIMKRLVSQDFDKEFFDMLLKSHNYKNAIAEASEVAEIKGKNAKIVAEKDKTKSDELPVINGGGMGKPAEVAEKHISSIGRVAQQNEEERRRIS